MAEPIANDWDVIAVQVASPGTPQQIASYTIPQGLKVSVKNRSASSGNYYIARTSAKCLATGTRKVLEPGESIILSIDDTNKIWRDADNANDYLEITFEQMAA